MMLTNACVVCRPKILHWSRQWKKTTLRRVASDRTANFIILTFAHTKQSPNEDMSAKTSKFISIILNVLTFHAPIVSRILLNLPPWLPTRHRRASVQFFRKIYLIACTGCWWCGRCWRNHGCEGTWYSEFAPRISGSVFLMQTLVCGASLGCVGYWSWYAIACMHRRPWMVWTASHLTQWVYHLHQHFVLSLFPINTIFTFAICGYWLHLICVSLHPQNVDQCIFVATTTIVFA